MQNMHTMHNYQIYHILHTYFPTCHIQHTNSRLRVHFYYKMSEDFRVVGMELLSNAEVELHSQEELEQLAKRRVISKEFLRYNDQVGVVGRR